MTTIKQLEVSLKQQLSDLAEQIRSVETDLLSKKEGYLKVSGALEVLEILKKEEEMKEVAEERDSLIAAGLAD